MGMVDFSACEIEYTKFYDGLNGKKLALYYNDELYMLKFPKENQSDDNYASSTINEYIGSHIFSILGFKTQETLLGYYKDKIVVACKDFEGFDKRLMIFGKVKNSALNENSSSNFLDTDFYETLKTIESQNIIEAKTLKDFYYEMFIADTFISNFDRHNGNWGFLVDKDRKVSIAPIYDCGSSLYPKLDNEKIKHYLNHKGSFNDLMLNQSTSAITIKNKKINPQNFLEEYCDENMFKALQKIYAQIDENKIFNVIDNIEIISNIRKLFYKEVIKERKNILERIIKKNLQEAQIQNKALEAKVSELLREQENISSMPRAKDFHKDFQKDLEESFNMKLDEDLKDEKNSNSQNKTNILRKRK